jgi:hypothetical protein
MAEAGKTEALEERVVELEKALAEAEREMGDVVGRMNMAQIEVAELQSERYVHSFSYDYLLDANENNRDEAMRQTRRLQNQIIAEREKVKALMS